MRGKHIYLSVASLPSSHTFNSMLASLSPRLPDAYLVTRIARRTSESYVHTVFISCLMVVLGFPEKFVVTSCTIGKPFIWHSVIPASPKPLAGHVEKPAEDFRGPNNCFESRDKFDMSRYL